MTFQMYCLLSVHIFKNVVIVRQSCSVILISNDDYQMNIDDLYSESESSRVGRIFLAWEEDEEKFAQV